MQILILDQKIKKTQTSYEYQELPTPKCNYWFWIRKLKKNQTFFEHQEFLTPNFQVQFLVSIRKLKKPKPLLNIKIQNLKIKKP